ncbi:hypothetical protein PR048_022988 [Dryococelus australis]|uniref:Long-chain-fatty-acid--CoA ligase n=1 Tax=Dryococelus australis TaxID=614101 RepID=A0ABQ9GSV4_9NEOP|nr:hypothetical protein PR048_022988 [Dryococelus australis]
MRQRDGLKACVFDVSSTSDTLWHCHARFVRCPEAAPRGALSRYAALLWQVRSHEKKDLTIADIFRQRVARHPNKVCFVFEDTEWTFAQVEDYSNKVANVFRGHGYRKGDVVALMMENRPEFVCLWLGLSKLGIVVSLINYNLRLHPLLHSVSIAHATALIFGAELAEGTATTYCRLVILASGSAGPSACMLVAKAEGAQDAPVKEVSGSLPTNMSLYRWSSSPSNETSSLEEKNLTSLLEEAPTTPPTVEEKVGYHDRLMYIYTSGTTGLPKAAVITHARCCFMALGITHMQSLRHSDVVYVPLPLYHSAGGILGSGQAFISGITVVIRRKFSASNYFSDCVRYQCTVRRSGNPHCARLEAAHPSHVA